MAQADETERPEIVRLCVDLNVWVRYLLAIRKDMSADAAHAPMPRMQ
jgi:hypothetical protein